MTASQEITVIIVNYRTLELTRRCLESLLNYYPLVSVILIDNGSYDESTEYITVIASRSVNITSIFNTINRYHGPALDQGIHQCRTPLALILDSDCVIKRGGFIEQMAACFDDQPNLYAVGKVAIMDPFGYEALRPMRLGFRYVRPYCMLLDREKYLKLKPFIHHGSPGIGNMRDAQRQGYKLAGFPVDSYVYHQGRGTCSRYGYGLGLRHTIENLLHRVLAKIG